MRNKEDLKPYFYKRSNNSGIKFIMEADSCVLRGKFPLVKNSNTDHTLTNLKIITIVEYPDWSSTQILSELSCRFQT
jgi:hypothetical protein